MCYIETDCRSTKTVTTTPWSCGFNPGTPQSLLSRRLRLWHRVYWAMTISPARIQCHMCFPSLQLSGNPLTCKRKEEKTHMCWTEELGGEEASEEGTSDCHLTGCGNTPFHSLLWQKNKHRVTKLSRSPALMDKRWLIPNETHWTTGNRRWGLTTGRACSVVFKVLWCFGLSGLVL